MSKMTKVTGVTRHSFLQWEEAISFGLPRNDRNERQLPESFVASVGVLKSILDTNTLSLGEWLQTEHRMGLNQPKDQWGMFDFSDPYWEKYFNKLFTGMKEATVDLDELLRWEWELQLKYHRDSNGNIVLTRDWVRYLQTVQEKYAEGKDVYWVAYNVPQPNQVRPQYASSVLGPEY